MVFWYGDLRTVWLALTITLGLCKRIAAGASVKLSSRWASKGNIDSLQSSRCGISLRSHRFWCSCMDITAASPQLLEGGNSDCLALCSRITSLRMDHCLCSYMLISALAEIFSRRDRVVFLPGPIVSYLCRQIVVNTQMEQCVHLNTPFPGLNPPHA